MEAQHHRGRALRDIVVFTLTLALGLVIAAWPMIRSSFTALPGDLGDARFIHYLLEHTWRWITIDPDHTLWDPPFFYPVENVGAFSDIMVASGPMYWIWRLLNIGPYNSYQLWIISCLIFNFVAAWLLLLRGLGFTVLAAAAGALLFSFGNPRLNQLNHLQLLPQFFVIVSIGGWVMLVRHNATGVLIWKRAMWSGMAVGGIVLQLYSGFYYGWFLLFSYLIAALWILIFPSLRGAVFGATRKNIALIAMSSLIGILALIPWMNHYIDAASLNPSQSYSDIQGWAPRWESWLYMGPTNWWYHWSLDWKQFNAIPEWTDHEHRLGIGIITMVAVGAGYLLHIKNRWVQLITLVTASLILLTTIFPGGFNAWRWVFEYVPGADAVRTVSRVGLIVLIPMSLGIAMCVEWLESHRRYLVALALVVASIAEQANSYATLSKEDAQERSEIIAAAIPTDCQSFLYSPVGNIPPAPDYPAYLYQLDAMWASAISGVPTVNGYGHNVPPNWHFSDTAIRSREDQERIQRSMEEWQKVHPNSAPICNVAIELQP